MLTDRTKTAIKIAALALTLVSVGFAAVLIPGLRISGELMLDLPDGELADRRAVARSLFPEPDFVMVSMPCADPFDSATLDRFAGLSERLVRATDGSGGSGAWNVLTPVGLEELSLVGDSLVPGAIVPVSGADPDAVRSRFGSSRLLRALFLSPAGDAWTLYLEPSLREDRLLDALETVRLDFPELRFSGILYASALNVRIMRKELFPTLGAAAAMMLAAALLLYRKAMPALALWGFSLAPTILLLGVISAAGRPFRLPHFLAPALTMAIATSYTIHLRHGWVAGRGSIGRALALRGDILILASLTTTLGFGSLALSPIRELRELGAFAVTGVVLALACALVGYGAALSLFRGRVPPLATVGKASGIGGCGSERRAAKFVWILVALSLAIASFPVPVGKSFRDFFPPWTEEGKELGGMLDRYNGAQDLNLAVETGREYGAVSLELFKVLEAMRDELAALEGVEDAWGFTDLVGEALARFEGVDGSVAPLSDADIGETIELLSGSAGGLFSRGFVDGDWSSVRFRIFLDADARYSDVVPAIERAANIALERSGIGADVLVSGRMVDLADSERLFIAGQATGLATFFVLAGLLLALRFRSVRAALLATAVPFTGLLVALVVTKALGWRLSEINAIAFATIAGVGIDDAIVIVSKGSTRGTRSAAFETTMIIVAALSPLLFSRSWFIVQAAAACIAGLSASTAVAIFLLPGALTARDHTEKPDVLQA